MSPAAADQIHRMQEFRARGVDPFRAMAWVCSMLGGLALVATAAGITRLVLRQSLRLAAAWLPCRRAARIDPITTLRYD